MSSPVRMGYHVAELSRKLGRTGIIIVFEPDATLLRAVLDQVDCSEWVPRQTSASSDPDDGAPWGTLRRLEGLVGLASPWCSTHPARALAPSPPASTRRLTGIVESVR